MCRIMEDLWKEASEKTKEDITIDMLKDGKLSIEEIVRYSKLPLEEVTKLMNELKTSRGMAMCRIMEDLRK